MMEPQFTQLPGVGPWEGPKPEGEHWDHELLELGDHRNVPDQYRYWSVEAIRAELDERLGLDEPTGPRLEIAIENLGHDFNIGSIVRTANALGVRRVHIVGRRRWNRRGAMVTDRYLHVVHHPEVDSLVKYAGQNQLTLLGFDNLAGAKPLENTVLPPRCLAVFGEESTGISPAMNQSLQYLVEISQYGSTRSLNVGHAAAIALFEWRRQHPVKPA